MHIIRDTSEQFLKENMRRFGHEPRDMFTYEGDRQVFNHLEQCPTPGRPIFNTDGMPDVCISTTATHVRLMPVKKARISKSFSGPDGHRMAQLFGEPVNRETIGVVVEKAEEIIEEYQRQNPGILHFMKTGIPNGRGGDLVIDIDSPRRIMNNARGLQSDSLLAGTTTELGVFIHANEMARDRVLELCYGVPRRWFPCSIQDMLDQNCFVTRVIYDPYYRSLKVDIEVREFYVASVAAGAEDPMVVERQNHELLHPDEPFIFDTLDKSHERTLKIVEMRKKLMVVSRKRAVLVAVPTGPEARALETLREMVTEIEFRRYLRDGFLCVHGNSGRVYQVFREEWHTKVWEKGKCVEEVCTRLKGLGIPPTDNVIAFKIAIEADEQGFKKLGNVYRRQAA